MKYTWAISWSKKNMGNFPCRRPKSGHIMWEIRQIPVPAGNFQKLLRRGSGFASRCSDIVMIEIALKYVSQRLAKRRHISINPYLLCVVISAKLFILTSKEIGPASRGVLVAAPVISRLAASIYNQGFLPITHKTTSCVFASSLIPSYSCWSQTVTLIVWLAILYVRRILLRKRGTCTFV